jgi:nucleoid DNA-binding protein
LSAITTSLAEGFSVELRGFGYFRPGRKRCSGAIFKRVNGKPSYAGRMPATQAPTVHFKPSRQLMRKMKMI